ncbi:hypothetical protein BKA83DRAFT_1809458 [Pisolithus microcarpus]|nr:hypothetical protein BKA83DRAFT_1809458 [Pisolithus microcarpus]
MPIESMCSRYHRSSSTTAYLSDVSDTAPLANSVWFSRGWTLQELLALPTLVFCMQDWSFVLNFETDNHKADPDMLEEVQKPTGVLVRHLKHFCPGSAGLDRASSMGMDDARSRLYLRSSDRVGPRLPSSVQTTAHARTICIPFSHSSTGVDS